MKKVISYLEEIRQVRMDYIKKNNGEDFKGCMQSYDEIKLIDEITRDIKNL